MSPSDKNLNLRQWAEPSAINPNDLDVWKGVVERGHKRYGKLSEEEFLKLARDTFGVLVDLAPFLAECRRRYGKIDSLMLRIGLDRRGKKYSELFRPFYDLLLQSPQGIESAEVRRHFAGKAGDLEIEELFEIARTAPKVFSHHDKLYSTRYFPELGLDPSSGDGSRIVRSIVKNYLREKGGEATLGGILDDLWPKAGEDQRAKLREAVASQARDLKYSLDATVIKSHEAVAEEGQHILDDLKSFGNLIVEYWKGLAIAEARELAEVRKFKKKGQDG